MRCVGKQLSGIIWHRLIRIDNRVRLRGWCDHVIKSTSTPFRLRIRYPDTVPMAVALRDL